jgi:hypothetical protein
VHPDTNRRFVGYIAQQVESVVPDAVQLIDGILHIDYESLLPYLSESVRANFNDIRDIRSKTDRIQQTIDSMYEQFIRTHNNSQRDSEYHQQRGWSRIKKVVFASLITTTILAAVIATLAFTGVITIFSEPTGAKFPKDFSAALKEFYGATNGDSWLRKDYWLDEQKSICEWYGISCKDEKLYLNKDNMDLETVTLIHLTLDNNNLTGTLPAALHKIKFLRSLNLRNNSLAGTIPEEFEMLKMLNKLNLSDNLLYGSLPILKKYASIASIDLSRNRFSGNIPNGFFSETLAEAKISHNEIEGSIPGSLQFLTVLDLSSNRLTGLLPFFSLELVYLNLADNMLEGETDPATFSEKLEYLNLANNKFFAKFSILMSLHNIVHLNISNNELTSWRDYYPRFPGKLQRCDASNNLFQCPFVVTWVEGLCNATCT